MSKRKAGIIGFILLVCEFYFIRYPLLFLHGMKDWPIVLAVVDGLIIFIGSIILANGPLAILTSIGYLVSFFLGQFFGEQTLTLDNSWLIWTLANLVFVALGLLISIIKNRFAITKKPIE